MPLFVYVNCIVQVPKKVRMGHGIPEIGFRQTCEPTDAHVNAEPLSKPSTLGLLLRVSELTGGKAGILIHRN